MGMVPARCSTTPHTATFQHTVRYTELAGFGHDNVIFWYSAQVIEAHAKSGTTVSPELACTCREREAAIKAAVGL